MLHTDLKYQRSLIHSKAAKHVVTVLLGHLAIWQQKGYLQQESIKSHPKKGEASWNINRNVAFVCDPNRPETVSR